MMRGLGATSTALLLTAGFAFAEPFEEVVVGVSVSSIVDAEAWYLSFLGSEVKVIRPFPGVVEFMIAPGVWYQIFEIENHQPSGSIVRFLVDDMAASQAEWLEAGIDTGEAIEVPNVVTYSEFTDPDGNALGLYELP